MKELAATDVCVRLLWETITDAMVALFSGYGKTKNFTEYTNWSQQGMQDHAGFNQFLFGTEMFQVKHKWRYKPFPIFSEVELEDEAALDTRNEDVLSCYTTSQARKEVVSSQVEVEGTVEMSQILLASTNCYDACEAYDGLKLNVDYHHQQNLKLNVAAWMFKSKATRRGQILNWATWCTHERRSSLVWHRWKNKYCDSRASVELFRSKSHGNELLVVRQMMQRSHRSECGVYLAGAMAMKGEIEGIYITGYPLALVLTYEWYHSPRPPEVLHNMDCWSSYSSLILEGKDALKKGVL